LPIRCRLLFSVEISRTSRGHFWFSPFLPLSSQKIFFHPLLQMRRRFRPMFPPPPLFSRNFSECSSKPLGLKGYTILLGKLGPRSPPSGSDSSPQNTLWLLDFENLVRPRTLSLQGGRSPPLFPECPAPPLCPALWTCQIFIFPSCRRIFRRGSPVGFPLLVSQVFAFFRPQQHVSCPRLPPVLVYPPLPGGVKLRFGGGPPPVSPLPFSLV